MSPAPARKPWPSDVSDEEWSLVAPYLTLMSEEAPQRDYKLRELFNALRYVTRIGRANSLTYGILGALKYHDINPAARSDARPHVRDQDLRARQRMAED